jgi:DHA1 family bicyclomycin/chloramphenicol resistance-like MFS transporter
MLQSADRDAGTVRRDISFGEFVGLIAAMMALTALAIDIMLPALGDIGRDVGLAEDNHRQLVITFYLVGFAVGQIIFGPLSDRFGRKTPLYAGFLLLAAASVLAALAESATMMFAARVLQGFGAAAARIIAVAIVRDRFAGREMARVMSFVMMIFIVIPILAPLMGQGAMQLGSWRWIFGALVIASLIALVWTWLRLPETHSAEKQLPLSVARLGQAVRSVLVTRQTVGYAAAFSFLFGVLMSYVGSVEQIFVDVYGLGTSFPLVFGAIACFMIPSFFLNSVLVRKVGMRRVSHFSLLSFLAACMLMAGAGYPEKPPLILFCLFIVVTFFCFGLIGPNFNAMAMEPVGHIAGTASSFIGFFTTTAGAFFGFLVGQSFDGTVRPLTIGFTLLGAAAMTCVLIVERGKLGRPQHEPPKG